MSIEKHYISKHRKSEIDRSFYRYDDFTESHYRELLVLAKNNYKFIGLDDLNTSNLPWVFYRHDVDFSVHRAYEIASIESSCSVKSTYFFQLTSSFYSLFEVGTREKALQILDLGHDAALHFDITAYDVQNEESFLNKLRFEKDILSNLLGVEIKGFSFHIPNEITKSFDANDYLGMVNFYSKTMQAEVGYVSDSNGYWRHERIVDVLKSRKHSKLQVLTHPCNWTETAMSPRDRILRCINGRAGFQQKYYDDLLASHGRENVGL